MSNLSDTLLWHLRWSTFNRRSGDPKLDNFSFHRCCMNRWSLNRFSRISAFDSCPQLYSFLYFHDLHLMDLAFNSKSVWFSLLYTLKLKDLFSDSTRFYSVFLYNLINCHNTLVKKKQIHQETMVGIHSCIKSAKQEG